MNNEKIKKDYLKKISLLQNHNEAYYQKNKPKISDAKYDDLKKEILDLEKKYRFLNSSESPSKLVGFKPSKNFRKVQHKVSMLSLSNAFNKGAKSLCSSIMFS